MFHTSRWWAREFVRAQQAHAQERRELLDRIMLLAGTPWTLPPSEPTEEPDEQPELVSALDVTPEDW